MDNDASELDILGHFGTIRKTFERVKSIKTFPTHLHQFSHNRLIEKNVLQTHGRTDRPSYKDLWTHLKTNEDEVIVLLNRNTRIIQNTATLFTVWQSFKLKIIIF